jgi:uncharacterized protein (DUF2267 family)
MVALLLLSQRLAKEEAQAFAAALNVQFKTIQADVYRRQEKGH